ncbi:hypothetical protein CHLRE_15g641400v5 [Chlamydomonas reinhardtii]|uniref:Uncharacterized protein n=1 Tax=Chlamydomonas reinhardtii TaxID=3055 RepID=A0A2K3CWV3_CHLRE|nr:uncharacterized protein CHLRE_15g641400v5 [Chlamydomonas reinhardtii]PNW72762.1 hypothetical protein CHLRE_15g641400v5 [Chlamydomonas reinhardtii]
MPISKGRASLDSAPVGSIEQALLTLKLSAKDPDVVSRLDKVLYTLRDVVSGPNIMMCEDQEALWWEAFAEVFASEVDAQTRACGGREPSPGCKRQILADILVWAEVTQEHYDSGTLRFVTEPHEADESFQRIGRTFRAVKASKGLGGASSSAGGGPSHACGGSMGGPSAAAAAAAGHGYEANAGAQRPAVSGSSDSAGSDLSSDTRS